MKLRKSTIAAFLAGAVGLRKSPAILSAQETETGAATPVTTGSGERYKTSISQETKNELKPEDARQVSLLGSRILTHVHNAAGFLGEEKADEARAELKLAQTLAKLVREMLPVPVVSTTTTNAQGKEVYRYEDRVQDDQIPSVEGLINVQVVEPIVKAKKEQAALRGVQLAGGGPHLHSGSLEPGVCGREIQQALAKLQEPEKARTELLAASARSFRWKPVRRQCWKRARCFFISLSRGARSRLWIASPYFVPDEDMVNPLQAAALRGVDLRITLPAYPDHLHVWLASFAYLEHMNAAGVNLYRYQEGFLHQIVVWSMRGWPSSAG